MMRDSARGIALAYETTGQSPTEQTPGSAMSVTKSEPKAFASLRFKGDRLEPERVSEILHAIPTTAYHKGEVYKRSRGHEACGRTAIQQGARAELRSE
jgi:hypothetical protein